MKPRFTELNLPILLAATLWLSAGDAHAQAPDSLPRWGLQLEAGAGYTFSQTTTGQDEQPSSNGVAATTGLSVTYRVLPQLLLHASLMGMVSPSATADIDAAHDKTNALLGLYSGLVGVTWASYWGPYVGVALGPSYLQAANLDSVEISPVGVAQLLRFGYVHTVAARWQLGAGAVILVASDGGPFREKGWFAGHASGELTVGVHLGATD